MSKDPHIPLTRRGFLGGAAVTGALTIAGSAEGKKPGPRILGPGAALLRLQVNGAKSTVMVEPRATLAQVLRDQLGLTGTKVGCDRGSCSACTVHVDKKPMSACLLLAVDCTDREIRTIEGLAARGTLHPVQAAFVEHDALQCGFCTPGMVMSCAALLAAQPKPSLDEVKTAVSGNTCRCGTYPKVFAAAMAASGQAVPPGDLVIIGGHRDGDIPKGQLLLGQGEGPLGTVARSIPKDEPPAWPENGALSVVGKRTPRVDGVEKVTGAARYTFDVKLPGMLYAKRVTSPHAHAEILSIDTTDAETAPGVRAVHVVETQLEGAKLQGAPKLGDKRYPTVRYAGQTVAAVAATSPEAAEAAAKRIRVRYELKPHVVDVDAARDPKAPLVYPTAVDMGGSAGGGGAARGLAQNGNVRGPALTEHGDVEAGLRKSKVKVTGVFRTQVQTHSAMEPHGVVADWKASGLTVYCSTQGTNTVRDELCTVFDLPASKVRVIAEHMGGGFGAKFGARHEGIIATHLSRKAGAPVRLVFDRKEEHQSGGNRPSTVQTLTLGASEKGELLAVKLESFGTGGIATGAGVGAVAERLYPARSFRGAQHDVFTHASPCAAFRAPGVPQGIFAVEGLVDELAERLGLDPLALRDRLDADELGTIDREARRLERKIGAEAMGWAKRRRPGSDPGRVKRGLGMAQSIWGRFVDMGSSAEVRIHRDGGVEVRSSVMDLGTGTRTALALVVAEELGLTPDQIAVRIGDTDHPQGPASGGSKTLLGVTPAVRAAAWHAKQKLFSAIAPRFKTSPERLVARGGQISVEGQPKTAVAFKKACAFMKTGEVVHLAKRAADYDGPPRGGYGGVQFAEVLVDTETGVIRVERVYAVHECGRPINPLAIQSQICGGVMHGLSWALYEDRVLDRRTGRLLNGTLDSYKIAGAKETPRIDVVLVEQYVGRTNTDVHGIGEPANIATAAAIASAVHNATGVRVRTLPMTPAVVLAALAGRGA